MRELLVGTAGHIDHGKTSLVKALTGMDTDRLEEEKRRGITIDIGFAHLTVDDLRLGFVDVPGHEKFVKNMLAGIGGIQLVLLVVAADESVMPQTVEHFHICRLLEIPRGIVALTKKSLVDPELAALVREEVSELVRGSFLEGAPVVEVDSVTGDGVAELRDTLVREARNLCRDEDPTAAGRLVFRLPIDRVFTIRGFGTVVTGTLYAGLLRRDAQVAALPDGSTAKVRNVEIFKEPAETARRGQRAALNLTGVEKQELERGMVLVPPGTFKPSFMLDTLIRLLPEAPAPLKTRTPIRLHLGSAEAIGRAYPLEGPSLEPGAQALTQLRLEKPVVACPGDHFVVRSYSPMTTIGGGVVLDNAPPKHRSRRKKESLAGLERLKKTWLGERSLFDSTVLESLVSSRGPEGFDVKSLQPRTGFTQEWILTVAESLPSLIRVPQEPRLLVERKALEKLEEKILAHLEDFHDRNPLAPGLAREELKNRFLPRASGAYFQFLLQRMEETRKIRTSGSVVALYDRRVLLNDEQQRVRNSILEAFDSHHLETPTLDRLLQSLPHPEKRIREVYYFLLQKGDLVRIAGDLVLSRAQIDLLKQRLHQAFPPGGSFTVAEFKELFRISRKYAIPFLEYLDRERITRRSADRRVVV